MLDRQIDILADTRIFADCLNKLIGDLVGIAVEHSYPRDRGLLGDAVQKLSQLVLAVEIETVARGVLSDDTQLLDAESFKGLCLLDKLFHRTRTEFSAYVRNSTVGAAVVAPLGDLQIGEIFGSRDYTLAAELYIVLVLEIAVALSL